MSKNSNLNPYEELANAIVLQAVRDYREAVKKLSRGRKNRDARLICLKAQIREVIAQVDKSEQQAVLRFRYIHNYSWPMIADELGVDRGTVQRWHNKAVAKITLPENAIDLKNASVCN